MTEEFAAHEAENLEGFAKAGGDVSHIKFYEGDVARNRTGVRDAIAAYEWPAGSIHPAKLAHWLLDAASERGVTHFTHCPVSKVERSPLSDEKWDIHMPRGELTASIVVHCTNAHAALLLPQLQVHLTPNRAQAHSLIAPPAFSGLNTLSDTYSLRYSLKHFYSLNSKERRRDTDSWSLAHKSYPKRGNSEKCCCV